jgi:hypothetical protein
MNGIYFPKRIAVIVSFAALLLFLYYFILHNATAQEEFGRQPTIVPARELTPAPTPPDDREVAILQLFISSTERGEIRGVRLMEAQIIRSYAPNVLRLAGPWTIELDGEKSIRYGTLDPRAAHVEHDEEDQDEIHQNVYLTETTWELVIPLYDREQDLGVRQINIYDERGERIFSTPVDREEWRKRGNQD